MKILLSPCHYIFDELESGSEILWAYKIGNGVATFCSDSVVVTGALKVPLSKPYKIVEVQASRKVLDFSILNSLRFNWLYFLETKKLFNLRSFDVLHHVLPFALDSTFNLFALLGSLRNTPFVIGPVQSIPEVLNDDVDLRDLRSQRPSSSLRFYLLVVAAFSPILKTLSLATLKRANRIVAINQKARDALVQRGCSDSKITIIPPGVDTKKFIYTPFETKSNDYIELITVAYLVKRKGTEFLIESMRTIVEKNNRIRLKIVGDGPQKDALVTLAKKYRLEESISFVGSIAHKDVPHEYSRSHIYVSMSKSEGFATVSLEAMACGLPIVSSITGGFADVIEDEVNGYLVAQGDVAGFCERILYLATNTHLISQFGKNSRLKAECEYDWERVIVPQYLHLYNELIQSKK